MVTNELKSEDEISEEVIRGELPRQRREPLSEA